MMDLYPLDLHKQKNLNRDFISFYPGLKLFSLICNNHEKINKDFSNLSDGKTLFSFVLSSKVNQHGMMSE